jgi:DNA-binding response OmpR family regulator
VGDTPRILIADDDGPIRSLLSIICKRAGYACDSAADGEQALAMIRSASYDVVLLDLMMPKMTGQEVIEALRKVPSKPAVIVLSAHGAKPVAADTDVVQAVVQKPFNIDTLSAVLVETARSMFDLRRSREVAAQTNPMRGRRDGSPEQSTPQMARRRHD